MKKIYFCATGGKYSDGKSYTRFKIFDFEEGEQDGEGFQYSLSGERYGHWWCHTESSKEIKNIPEDVEFSFHHGSSGFFVLDEDIKNCETFEELLSKSDFEFVTKKEVEDAKKRKEAKNVTSS